MSADPDGGAGDELDDVAPDGHDSGEGSDESSQVHTGEGVETIGGRESSRDQERDWEFSLADIEKRENEPRDEGNVAGSLMSDQPLEAGDIDLENAFFVLLGVLLVVGLIASLLLAI